MLVSIQAAPKWLGLGFGVSRLRAWGFYNSCKAPVDSEYRPTDLGFSAGESK